MRNDQWVLVSILVNIILIGCGNNNEADNIQQVGTEAMREHCTLPSQNSDAIINIKNQKIINLKSIKNRLLEPASIFEKQERINSLIEKINQPNLVKLDNIPDEIVNYLFYVDDNSDTFATLYSSHLPLSNNELKEQYVIDYGFFALTQELIDDDIKLTIAMDKNKEIPLITPYNYIPIAGIEGEYTVVDLTSQYFGQLLYINEIQQGSFYALSLIEHIDDLISGLENGSYPINKDGNLVYPYSWNDRELVQEGKRKNPPCNDEIMKLIEE